MSTVRHEQSDCEADGKTALRMTTFFGLFRHCYIGIFVAFCATLPKGGCNTACILYGLNARLKIHYGHFHVLRFRRFPPFVRLSVATCPQLMSKRSVLWTRKGVRATVVTAGHCRHAELTSGHALASCYSCCVHSLPGLC